MKELKNVNLIEELEETFEAVKQQLLEDEKRWGDTWKNRPIEGQTERIRTTFNNYFDRERYGGDDVDWAKVIGNAHIAMVRKRYNKNK
jgi:septation ring formation regulator EzrA